MHPLVHMDYCLKQVIENNRVACIFQNWQVIGYAAKYNLHISERFMLKVANFRQTQLFYALTDQFYYKSLNFQESGIKSVFFNLYTKQTRKKFKADERLKRIVDYLIIDAVDLTYLYIFVTDT